MEKPKNIRLLIGNASNLMIFFFSVVSFLASVSNFSEITFKQYLYQFNEHIMPAAILLLISAPSIILFVMNLKNKRSVVLPVISLIANILTLCVLLLLSLPSILQYIILRGINIIDSAVFYCIYSFFSKNGLAIWMCCSILIAGSILSLADVKRSKQNEA